MAAVKISNLIAGSFHALWGDCMAHGHMDYWLKGGRGSTKSSWISLAIVKLMMVHPFANCVVVRKVGNTLRDSVYEQIKWAIITLGVEQYWHVGVSPMDITYKPTGQQIKFRGSDDPVKLKSTKFSKGYSALLWFEELDQFDDWDEVHSILNSFRRGGELFWTFYSYNPPKVAWSWVNKQALDMEQRPKAIVHSSSYLDIVASHPEWLGQAFIDEAEYVRDTNKRQYEWEYLGNVTGTGGSVFENLIPRAITDEEIAGFDNPRNGADWGWFPDPWRFVRCEYQPAQRRILIFDEASANKTVPRETGKIVKEKLTYPDGQTGQPRYHNQTIWCDTDETSIAIWRREVGLNARPASKGDMRKQSYIWLASQLEIVIDPQRCPLTYEEFALCEYKKDKDGNWMEDFNDGNDHSIDAVRYAFMEDAKRSRW